MGPEEMKEKALELFSKRFHCSQAVLSAGMEKLGCIEESVVKAMGLFGGGISGTGSVCGALIGAVAVVSCMYSRGNLEEKEDPRMWRMGKRLSRRFEELTAPYGGIDCRDIAQVDWRDREAARKFYTDPESRRKICFELVGEMAKVVGELIEEETARVKP